MIRLYCIECKLLTYSHLLHTNKWNGELIFLFSLFSFYLLLGRNSPANEPWPDVLGVAVVFLVTGMFMLGLEV